MERLKFIFILWKELNKALILDNGMAHNQSWLFILGIEMMQDFVLVSLT